MFRVLNIKGNAAPHPYLLSHLLFFIRILGFKEFKKQILVHKSLETIDGNATCRSIGAQDIPFE
jgi:hypothetical protein